MNDYDGSPVNSVADGEVHLLDPRWIPCQRRSAWLSSAVPAVLLAVLGAGAVLLAGMPVIPVTAAAGFLVVLSVWFGQWWPGVEYRYASYRLEGRTLEIRRGVLWRSCINVPRSRIQHSDVSQGPFERQFHLGTLTVHTAGTSHAQVKLEGLEHSRALAIRAYLMQADEDDVI